MREQSLGEPVVVLAAPSKPDEDVLEVFWGEPPLERHDLPIQAGKFLTWETPTHSSSCRLVNMRMQIV